MAKKSNKARKQRRKKEILKAQAKSGLRGQLIGDVDIKQPKKVSHRLHLREIRTDLLKTFLFAIFVVILLVVLKSSGLQFDLSINK